MECTLVIPVRSFADAKSRLTQTLSGRQRANLMQTWVTQVINAGKHSKNIAEIVLVSGDDEVRSFASQLGVSHFNSAESLNPALHAWQKIRQTHNDVIVALGDLPLLDDLDPIIERLRCHDVVICPDRYRIGTNLVAHHSQSGLNYRFGENSFSTFLHDALVNGANLCVYQSCETELDIDTPEDFNLLNTL